MILSDNIRINITLLLYSPFHNSIFFVSLPTFYIQLFILTNSKFSFQRLDIGVLQFLRSTQE